MDTLAVREVADLVGVSTGAVEAWTRAGFLVVVDPESRTRTYAPHEVAVAVVVLELGRLAVPASVVVDAASLVRGVPLSCWTNELRCYPSGLVRLGAADAAAAWVVDLAHVAATVSTRLDAVAA